MAQRGDGAGFAFESRYPVFVQREFGRQNFEGHAAAEARILRKVDNAHAAGTELGQDLILRDRLPNHVLNDVLVVGW